MPFFGAKITEKKRERKLKKKKKQLPGIGPVAGVFLNTKKTLKKLKKHNL